MKLDEDVASGKDGVMGGDTSFYDTGSMSLNALISGSIFGGFPNKITCIAGEPATGKTFFALQACQIHLQKKDNVVVYFESEAGLTNESIKDRGLNTKNFVHFPVTTVEEFRNKCTKVLERWEKSKSNGKLFIVLDSLGALSTEKEITDIEDEKNVRDMTKSQLVKGAFRVLDMKLARLDVPLLVTNHVYASMGSFFPENVVAGGGGVKYSASTIIVLGKKKEKDGKDVIGNIIRLKNYKSRFTKENAKADSMLNYNMGLDKYYGLLDIAETGGVAKKVGTKWSIGGQTAFQKAIYKNPEKYFTDEVLKEIDIAAGKHFKYGSAQPLEEVVEKEEKKKVTKKAAKKRK